MVHALLPWPGAAPLCSSLEPGAFLIGCVSSRPGAGLEIREVGASLFLNSEFIKRIMRSLPDGAGRADAMHRVGEGRGLEWAR